MSGLQNRSEHFSEKKIVFLPGFETRTLLPLALSLYRPCYAGYQKKLTVKKISNWCFRRTKHNFVKYGKSIWWKDSVLSRFIRQRRLSDLSVTRRPSSLSSRRSTINFASYPVVRGFRYRLDAWYIDKCSSSPPQLYFKIRHNFLLQRPLKSSFFLLWEF